MSATNNNLNTVNEGNNNLTNVNEVDIAFNNLLVGLLTNADY